jgi:hypothetical protein
MGFGRNRREHAMRTSKALVPTLLPDLGVFRVDIVEEAAVSDMKLVRGYTNNGSFET